MSYIEGHITVLLYNPCPFGPPIILTVSHIRIAVPLTLLKVSISRPNTVSPNHKLGPWF